MSAPNPDLLRDSFVYYTECQLATLESLAALTSPSKSELTRQSLIAEGMVLVCRRMFINANEIRQLGCPRVLRALYPLL